MDYQLNSAKEEAKNKMADSKRFQCRDCSFFENGFCNWENEYASGDEVHEECWETFDSNEKWRKLPKEKSLFSNNKEKEMKNQMEADLIRLKDFLNDRKIKFRVVGSIALQVCGIDMGRNPEDIDIEVECTPEQETLFKDLAEAYGSDYHKQKDYGVNKPYIFMFGNTIVDVWCYRSIKDNSVWQNNIPYAPIGDVLAKKLSYKRKKDFGDLLTVIGKLTSLASL